MKRRASIPAGLSLAAVLLTGPAMAADIASLTQPCEDCHGKDGVSQDPKMPTIGGFSAIYIVDSLTAYRDKSRPCVDFEYPAGPHKGETSNMCDIAGKLSDEEMERVGEHYEGKPFVAAEQAFDAELAKQGKGIHALKCKKCHEDGGSSPDDDAGILAGQWMPYLEEQLDHYMTGKRPMPEKMQPKMEKLSEDDLKALVHYYGSQQ
jgi:sulfide dehydrogenase cytochrome subunit